MIQQLSRLARRRLFVALAPLPLLFVVSFFNFGKALATEVPNETPLAVQSGGDFSALVPADTVLYFSIPDLARAEKKAANLPWAKLCKEEEVKKFIEAPQSYLKEKGYPAIWKKLGENVPNVDFTPLQNLKIQSIDLAIGGLELSSTDDGEHHVQPNVYVAVGCVDSAALEGLLAQLVEKQAEKMGEVLSVESEKIGGSTVHYVHEKDEQDEPHVTWFSHQGRFFIVVTKEKTQGQTFAKRVLEKGMGSSLSQDKEYQSVMGKISGTESEIKFFLRVAEPMQKLFVQFKEKMKAENEVHDLEELETAERIIEVVGLSGLKALGVTSTPQDSFSLNQCFFSAPAPRKGLFQAFSSVPYDKTLLAKIPKEAQSFSIWGCKMDVFWNTIWEGIKAADEEHYKKGKEMLAGFETQLGVKLKEDFIDAMGEKWAFYSMPMQSLMMGTPDLYLLVELKDRAKFEKSFLALLNVVSAQSDGSFQIKENEMEGGKFYSLAIPDLAKMGPMASVVPSFAFTDSYMVVGLSKSGIKRTLKRLANPEAEGASMIADFAKRASQIPADACSVGYSDARPTITAVYSMVQMFAPMLTAQIPGELPIDFALMPSASTINKHFFGEVSYSRVDEAGIYSKNYSPFGIDTVLGFSRMVEVIAIDVFAITQSMGNKGAAKYEDEDDMEDAEDLGDDEIGDTPVPPVPPVPAEPVGPEAQVKQALMEIKSGLTLFKLETGKYPAKLELLLVPTANLPEGYLPSRKSIPADAWNHSYIYQLAEDGKSYKLRSPGANGQDDQGKGDDIVGN